MLTIVDILNVYSVCDRLLDYLVYDDLKLFSINERLERILKVHAPKVRKLKKEKTWALKQPLKNVQRQSEEICLAAVERCGEQLKYVKNQTMRVIEKALDTKLSSFRHVREQTDELCKMTLERDGICIKWVKNITYELCLLAVNRTVGALKVLNFVSGLKMLTNPQYYRLCEIAIEKHPHSLIYVNDSKVGKKQMNKLYMLATGKSKEEIEKYQYMYDLPIPFREGDYDYFEHDRCEDKAYLCRGKKTCRYEAIHMKQEAWTYL